MGYRTRETLNNETQQARSCPITVVCEHFGYTLKKRGSIFTVDGEPGLTIFPNTNSFYNYYFKSGGSPIDFVMNETGFSVGDAIHYICDSILFDSISQESYMPLRSVVPDKSLIAPEKSDRYSRVFAYLSKFRGISADIISDFMHKKLLYEEKNKHNAVFVGCDKHGEPKHYFIRGTISGVQFRGDSEGSQKEYGFSYTKKSNKLIVFEAPIDLMSFMTLQPNDDSNLLALGMLSAEPIEQFLKEHNNIKEIYFLLDNDVYGKNAANRYKQDFQSRGFVSDLHPMFKQLESENVKDVNDLLMKVKQLQKGIGGHICKL